MKVAWSKSVRSKYMIKVWDWEDSLVAQRLGHCAFTAEGPGLICAQRTRISHTLWHGHK